jgi:hypothetical protein
MGASVGAGDSVRGVALGDLVHQPREAVRTARRRQRPHVAETVVGRPLTVRPSHTASPHTLPLTSSPYIKPAIPLQQPGSSTAGSLHKMIVHSIIIVDCHIFGSEYTMRTIALEEHYATGAFMEGPGRELKARAEAARDHPRVAAGYEGLIRRLCDLGEGRISEMEAAGVDVQVLSLTSPGVEQLDAGRAVSLAREANETLAEATRRHPGHFAGFATLPTAAPEAAAEELERAVREHGFVGTLINGHTRGRYLDDPFFWPILERAETLGVPIYLHPTPPPQPVVEAYYSGNFAPGWPAGWRPRPGAGTSRPRPTFCGSSLVGYSTGSPGCRSSSGTWARGYRSSCQGWTSPCQAR